MEGHAEYLPSELWQFIFRRVGDGDLKALSLVCKDFLTNSNPLKESLKVIHPNIGMLSQHLNRFKGLKAIDLSGFKGDVDEAIREIEHSGISLEALKFSIEKLCWGQSMEDVRGFCPKLKALNCKIRSHITRRDLVGIAIAFPNLEQLSLQYDWSTAFPNLEQLSLQYDWSTPFPKTDYGFEYLASKFKLLKKIKTDSGFEYLASKLKLLKKIQLRSCCVSDESLIALSSNCVLLKDVTIGGFNEFTETGLAHLLRNTPNLESLSIECTISESRPSTNAMVTIENSISHANALTSLVLCGMRKTDDVLMAIATAKLRLNSLGLVHCKDLTVSGLLGVLSNHILTKLRIEGSIITDRDMQELVLNGDVGKLTHIKISECRVTESTLFLLSTECPSLIEINMSKINIGKFYMQLQNPQSPGNHNTRSLRLDANAGIISYEFVKKIALFFPNLKVLNLSHFWDARNTSASIEAILECCKHITDLTLRGFESNKLFKASKYSNLLNLEVLRISFLSIDDAGLVAITEKCPRLLSLNIDRCGDITTEGIKQVVEANKNLTSLTMYNDNVNYGPNYGALLDWMLSTSNLASLNKIFLPINGFTQEQRDKFLHHGLLIEQLIQE